MQDTHNILILTDHSGHSAENSLYEMINELILHPYTDQVYVSSRTTNGCQRFFESNDSTTLMATPIKGAIAYDQNNHPFEQSLIEIDASDFNFVWLRLPPPLGYDFLTFLHDRLTTAVIVNNPMGIYETGSKAFLNQFADICAPMRLCDTIKDIDEFRSIYQDIILKPNRSYGGLGLVRIVGEFVYQGDLRMSYDQWVSKLINPSSLNLTAVKFLDNVTQGDKRIIIANGVIIGASLRLPAIGSWVCNVAMGGSSHSTDITPEEYQIVETVNPILTQKGIVMYGIDTLMGDDGSRVLSEINTTSIGGVPQIAKLNNRPLVKKTIDQIWANVINRII